MLCSRLWTDCQFPLACCAWGDHFCPLRVCQKWSNPWHAFFILLHVIILPWPMGLTTACLTGLELSMTSCCRIWGQRVLMAALESELHFRLCATGRNGIKLRRDAYRSPGSLSGTAALGSHWSLVSFQALTVSGRLKISSGSVTNSKPWCTAHVILYPSYYLTLPDSSESCWTYHMHNFAKCKPLHCC